MLQQWIMHLERLYAYSALRLGLQLTLGIPMIYWIHRHSLGANDLSTNWCDHLQAQFIGPFLLPPFPQASLLRILIDDRRSAPSRGSWRDYNFHRRLKSPYLTSSWLWLTSLLRNYHALKLDKAQMSKSQLYICQIHATIKNIEFGEVWAKLAGVVRRNLSSKRDF